MRITAHNVRRGADPGLNGAEKLGGRREAQEGFVIVASGIALRIL